MALDPLQLSAATALEEAYRQQSLPRKPGALANRVEQALQGRR